MTRRNGAVRHAVLAGAGVLVALALFLVAPRGAAADDADTATLLINRSREAASLHEFQGTMVVTWRAGGQLRERRVDVVERDGVLHLGDDRVIGAGARRLLKTDGGWRLLWSGAPKGSEPDPTGKYRFTVSGNARVAGRPATVVAITNVGDDHVQERMFFDRETDLLLRRAQYDDSARLVRGVGFVTISTPRPVPASTRDALPKVAGKRGGRAPWALRHAPDDLSVHRRIGDDFVLLGTYGRSEGGAQLYYSDGLFGLSLFERAGDLAWEDLPDGGRSIELGDIDARMYPTPAGSAVVWEHADVTYTCVTDAPLADVEKVATDIDRWHERGTLEDVGHFVTAPFSWG